MTDEKIDVEELLEKAEICFLDQIGYDASHSQERLEHLIAENQSLDILSMSQIARAYALRCQGGPIYKCLDIYAKIKTSRSIDADTMEFLFWLRMAGSPIMVKKASESTGVATSSEAVKQHHLDYLMYLN